jgi:hypothetical protein
MNWLKDFFFCNTWRELFVAAVVGAMGFIVFWALDWCLCLCCSDSLGHRVPNIYFKENQND